MTRFNRIAMASALVCSATVGIAHAEAVDNPSWYIMPSIGVTDPDKQFNGGDNAPGVGLRFGKQVSPSWDVQLGGTHSRDRGNATRYEQSTLGVDGLYMFKRGNVRPFALIGAGAQRDKYAGTGENSPYVNIGAGVQVALSDQWFMQADVRRARANLRGNSFAFDRSYTNSANIGVAYYFDKPPQPVRQAQYVPPPAPAPVVQAPPPPPPAPVPPPPPPAPRFERVTLSATELFAFDSAELTQPQPKLDEIARVLGASGGNESITITGYTDRLGSEAYNQKLSQRRADAVKAYLAGKGVSTSRLNAQGKGEANPVVQCDQKNRAALIKCLEPNRRVEVEQIVIERRVN
ncbi:MAG TPA: OmpA family protein [Burkholderiaceae bacterium]